MPNRAKERALVAQTIVDLIKIIRRTRTSGLRSMENIVISAAVVAGDAAGHPRTAAELARALDLPRVTVQRKLAELTREGLIERRGTRYYMLAQPPLGFSYLDDALKVLRRAKFSENG